MSGFTTRFLAPVLAVSLALAGPTALAGQEWRLDAQGGQLRFDASPAAGTSSTALGGLRYLDGATWLALYAGLPVEDDDAPWGLASGNLRLLADAGPLGFGADLGGEFFLQGDVEGNPTASPLPGLPTRPTRPRTGDTVTLEGGTGVVGEAMALATWEGGLWSAEASAGAARYRSTFGSETFDRNLTRVRTQVSVSPLPTLNLTAEASWDRAEEADYPYVGLTAAGVAGRLMAWGSVGRWLETSVEGTAWGAGARLDVMDRLAVTASARHTAFDPLYLSAETTSWSVGLSLLLKGPPTPAAPVPAAYENGVALISLPAGAARGTPQVAGDFNDWQPAPMRAEDGRWTFPVAVEPGVYYYAFVTGDGTWYVPESVPGRQDDGFGGHVAVLVVQ